MNVSRHLSLGQRVERAPVPSLNRSRPDLEGKFPILCLNARGRPRCQDREVLDKVLAWRNSIGLVSSRISAGKTSGDHGGLLYSVVGGSGDSAVFRACGSLPGEPDIAHRIRKDRKSVVSGKSVSVRVDLGGRRIITTKK